MVVACGHRQQQAGPGVLPVDASGKMPDGRAFRNPAELKKLLPDHQATARPPLYPHTTEGAVTVDKTAAEKATPEDEYVVWPN